MTNLSSKNISTYSNQTQALIVDEELGPYLPTWQASPVIKDEPINRNMYRVENNAAKDCVTTAQVVFGGFMLAKPGSISSENRATAKLATLQSLLKRKEVHYDGAVVSKVFLPVFDSFRSTTLRRTVGVIMAYINWEVALEGILPDEISGITAVVENTCDGKFTFEVNGPYAVVVGVGDLYDRKYTSYERVKVFDNDNVVEDGTSNGGIPVHKEGCIYRLHLFPSEVSYISLT